MSALGLRHARVDALDTPVSENTDFVTHARRG